MPKCRSQGRVRGGACDAVMVEPASLGHVPEFEVAVAQARLDELIDRAVAGEEIVVTSNGVPLAVLESLRGRPEQPASAPAR